MAEQIRIIEEYRNGKHIMRVMNPILLDPAMADEMTKRLSEMFESGAQKVIINIGMVNRMSSLFFRSFIIAAKKAKEKNAKLAFCNVNPTIKAGFEMMKMDAYFKFFSDESKAFDEM